jgi:type VI secretion system protein ImpA
MHTSDRMARGQGAFDIESLLRPIAGANGAGNDLADDDEYQAIREQRRADVDIVLRDDPFDKSRRLFRRPDQKLSDWNAVLRLGCEALRSKTKDLQIAAWIAEALGQLRGFDGLRDGFVLLHQLQEQFWANIYPRLEPGDPESRFGPYDFLNSEKVLPLLIRALPLTGDGGTEGYCYADFASMTQNDELIRKNPDVAQQALRGPNKIVSEDWQRAVAQTPRSFYEQRTSELTECLEAFNAWEESTVALFPRGPRGQTTAPSITNVRRALEACRDVVGDILLSKPAPPSAVEPDLEPVDEPPPEDMVDANGVADAHAEGLATTSTPIAAPLPVATRPATLAPLADRDTAYKRLLDIIEFLRKDDPDNPVSYLLVRAYRIAELYGLAGRPPESERPGPSSEVRQELRRTVADGRWDEALDHAEHALGRVEGRVWLDAHRYAIQALEATDRQNAALACRSLLRMALRDFPDLLETELDDGTAAADAKTRLWIENEGLLGPDQGAPEPAPAPPQPALVTPPTIVADQPQIDIKAQAAALVAAGRGADAVALLDAAMASAASGRDRFLLELQLAETCLRLGSESVALAFLEDLERQIDGFRLEEWEHRELCARVFDTLFNCLKERGPAERLQQIHARLCKLDVRRAMQSGTGPARR